MIEPVIQRHTGDIDAVIAHVGEIGKPQPSWRMLLPSDLDVGGHAALSFAIAAVDPVRDDRRWRR